MTELVTIQYICDNPAKYEKKEGGLPVVDKDGNQVYGYIYKILVKSGDESFTVETFNRTKEDLEKAGIKPGAVGHLTYFREAKPSKNGGVFTSVNFRKFNLANAGLLQEVIDKNAANAQ